MDTHINGFYRLFSCIPVQEVHDGPMHPAFALSAPRPLFRAAEVALLPVLGLIGLIVISDPVPAGPS